MARWIKPDIAIDFIGKRKKFWTLSVLVVAASLAMLATSGIVALATAAPVQETAVEDAELEAWISAQIDEQYREVMARSQQ